MHMYVENIYYMRCTFHHSNCIFVCTYVIEKVIKTPHRGNCLKVCLHEFLKEPLKGVFRNN